MEVARRHPVKPSASLCPLRAGGCWSSGSARRAKQLKAQEVVTRVGLKSKRDPREVGLAWKEGLEVASRELLTTRSILVRKGHQVGQSMLEGWGGGQK